MNTLSVRPGHVSLQCDECESVVVVRYEIEQGEPRTRHSPGWPTTLATWLTTDPPCAHYTAQEIEGYARDAVASAHRHDYDCEDIR